MKPKPENGEPNDKRGTLVGVGSDVKHSGNQNPVATFKGLLADFAGGIRSLAALAERRQATTVPVPVRASIQHAASTLERTSTKLVHERDSQNTSRNASNSAFASRESSQNTTRLNAQTTVLPGKIIQGKDSKSVERSDRTVLSFADSKTKGSNSAAMMSKEISKMVESLGSTSRAASHYFIQDHTRGSSQNQSSSTQTNKVSNTATRDNKTTIGHSSSRSVSSLGIQPAMATAGMRNAARRPLWGADKEAFRQVNEVTSHSSIHHMPSPARLAQIMHADAMVRRGEGRPSPELQALADGIRSGHRREVADLDPERVQEILNHSMGGASRAAQVLNTPLVNHLVERHESTIKSLQSKLSSKDRMILKDGVGPSPRAIYIEAPPVPKSTGGIMNSRFEANDNSTSVGGSGGSASSVTGGDTYAPELLNMAMTNDTPHLHAAAADAGDEISNSVRHYRNADRTLSSSGTSGGGDTTLAAFSAGPRPVQNSYSGVTRSSSGKVSGFDGGTAAPKTKGPMNFESSSPAGGHAAGAMKEAMAGAGGKSKKSTTLTGKLKLFGENGQSLGSAMLEGEM